MYPEFALYIYGMEIPDISPDVKAYEVGIVSKEELENLPDGVQNFNVVRNRGQFESVYGLHLEEMLLRNGWASDEWMPIHREWVVMTLEEGVAGGLIVRLQSLLQRQTDIDNAGGIPSDMELCSSKIQTNYMARIFMANLSEMARFQWGGELDENSPENMMK